MLGTEKTEDQTGADLSLDITPTWQLESQDIRLYAAAAAAIGQSGQPGFCVTKVQQRKTCIGGMEENRLEVIGTIIVWMLVVTKTTYIGILATMVGTSISGLTRGAVMEQDQRSTFTSEETRAGGDGIRVWIMVVGGCTSITATMEITKGSGGGMQQQQRAPPPPRQPPPRWLQ